MSDPDPVGAFVVRLSHPTPGVARPSGDPPLAGVSLVTDDLLAIEGIVTGAGNPDWRRTHQAATETAPALRRLIASGAALIATTVVDELGYGVLGVNPHHGTPTNPVTPDSVPGGAAAGAAAAVAAGLADAAIVADTGGGARLPASLCGLYGLRPTTGRVPTVGMVARAVSFDTIGVLARDATVLWRVSTALLDSSTGGAEPASPGAGALQRVLLADDVWDVADDEVIDVMLPEIQRLALRLTVRHVERLAADDDDGGGGGTGTGAGSPGRGAAGLETWAVTESVLVGTEIWHEHQDWLRATNPTMALDLKRRLDAARAFTADEIDAARDHRERIARRLDALLRDDAVLAVPTTPAIAPLLDGADADYADFCARARQLTAIAGLGGLPQVTVPLVQLAEYPVGLSLIGPRGADERLLALAATITRPA